MQNQQGFVGVLIVILVGLATLGGGAYYILRQNSLTPTPTENSLNSLSTASTQTIATTAKNPASIQQATQLAPSTFTAANLTASVMSGGAPLTVNLIGQIEVPNNQRGAAVIFFGDGVSDVMSRSGSSLFSEEWTHTYSKPGEYDVILVLTSVSDVDSDIEVLKNPNYYKNVLVKKIHISAGSAAQLQKINWHIESANPSIVDANDSRKYEQAISVDITLTDNTTKRYSLGTAYGCTGSTVESTQDGKKVLGKVNCYFALTGVDFVAYSQNGRFVVEKQSESAKDGSMQKIVVLEI
jgi:hypothetical protein